MIEECWEPEAIGKGIEGTANQAQDLDTPTHNHKIYYLEPYWITLDP